MRAFSSNLTSLKTIRPTTKFSWYIAIIWLIYALAFTYLNIFYGLNLTDEPWHLMNAKFFDSSKPATVLSYLIGNLWGKTFGFTIYSFRIFAAILAWCMAIIVTVPFFIEQKNIPFSISLTCIVVSLQNLNYWGYDSITRVFWAIGLVLCWFLLKWRSMGCAFLLGVLGAILTFVRFPNLVILPIVLIILTVFALCRFWTWQQSIKNGLLCTIGFLFGIIVLSYIVAGALSSYISSFQGINFGRGHSITELISSYFMAISELGCYFLMTLGIYFIFQYFSGIKKEFHKLHPFLELFSVALLVAFINWRSLEMYGFYIQYTLISIILVVILNAILKSSNKLYISIYNLAFIAFALIPAAGSDSGLLRATFTGIIPICLIILTKFKLKFEIKFFIGGIIGLLLFIPYQKSVWLYEDRGIRFSTSIISINGINTHTTPQRAKYLKTFINYIEKSKSQGKTILFAGTTTRFMMEYLYEERPEFSSQTFTSRTNDPDYINAVMTEAKTKDKDFIIIMDGEPEEPSRPKKFKTPRDLDDAVLEAGYKLCPESTIDYRIYSRQ